jgi:hypothetical protein
MLVVMASVVIFAIPVEKGDIDGSLVGGIVGEFPRGMHLRLLVGRGLCKGSSSRLRFKVAHAISRCWCQLKSRKMKPLISTKDLHKEKVGFTC